MRALWYATVLLFCALAVPAFASETEGTILPSDTDAWGDGIGWIHFAPTDVSTYRGLVITDTAVTGYAWSRDFGWINFNPTNSGQGVTNTPEGQLGGQAWVGVLGWISMQGVSINNQGYFVGIAGTTGTDTGRISFTCDRCSVRTDWRPASVRGGSTNPNPGGNGGGGGTSGTRPTSTAPTSSPPSVLPISIPTLPIVATVLPALENLIPAFFGGTPVEESETTRTPDFLLDISFRPENTILGTTDTLRLISTFIRFGLLDTPVGAVYSVYDASGTLIASQSRSFVLETERTEIVSFEGLALMPGQYRAEMVVLYGEGTREVFSRSFTVVAADTCYIPAFIAWLISFVPFLTWFIFYFGCWFWWLLILLLVIIAFLVYRAIKKHREDDIYSL